MDVQNLDFEQAKAKHFLFKAKLRAMLYGIEVDEETVLSQHECNLGQWIYNHALKVYGHIPQIVTLEKVHADIHTSAQKLIALYRQGKVQEARKGLSEMEAIADQLLALLQEAEQIIRQTQPTDGTTTSANLAVRLEEFHEILKANIELDKLIKEQVKETEKAKDRFETLIETLEEGITLHNSDGKITSANGSAQKLLGLTLNELTGKDPFDAHWRAVHEDGSDYPGEEHPPYLAVTTKKTQANKIMGIHRKDGTLAWMQVNSSPLLNPDDGELMGAVTSFFDITAIKKTEEELRLFKLLSDLADDALILMRADGSFAYLNTQAKKRWGYTDEEAMQIRVPNVDPAYHQERFKEVFKRAQKETIPVFESMHKRKDGSVFPVEINMRSISIAGELYLFAVARDITERKKSEDDLRESEERFKLAVENTEAGVFDSDLISRKTIRSFKHAQIYGYSDNKEEWTVDKIASHILPEDYLPALEVYKESLKTGVLDSSYRIKRFDGAIRWINVVGKVYYNEGHEPVRIIGITTDITEKKALQKQKDEFISTVSHELKTPVTSIKAYNQFLKRSLRGEENSRNRSFLDRMDVQINRLQTLIRDLLDVTRLENNKLILKEEPLELNILLTEMISDLQLITPTHQLFIVENTPVSINSDRDRIIQVITNLITNAVKYSPQKGKIYISLKKEKDFVVCSIEDFGIGIPEEQHLQIFERFHQVGNHNQQAGLSLGLGLYISKEIICKAGGEIWLESAIGKGTKFYFSLPL